ncbi:hypothetical protein UY3_10627 [Chelonia mydas]|uniref:Uncharacterized protein n=1 Tax=Chelonia mydas TaxID=8469 RepID=M7BVT4_CHEMY|nr:hypothetical protein UY3_10627 [Chelonia mydas]
MKMKRMDLTAVFGVKSPRAQDQPKPENLHRNFSDPEPETNKPKSADLGCDIPGYNADQWGAVSPLPCNLGCLAMPCCFGLQPVLLIVSHQHAGYSQTCL